MCVAVMQQGLVTFEDVSVRFSEEEWKSLQEKQKELYRAVMTDNYQHLTSLGLAASKPDIVMKIERGEDPFLHQEPPGPKPPSLRNVDREEAPGMRTQKLAWDLRSVRGSQGDAGGRGAERNPSRGEGRLLRSRKKRPQPVSRGGASTGKVSDVAGTGNAEGRGKKHKAAVQELPPEEHPGQDSGEEGQRPAAGVQEAVARGVGTWGGPQTIKEEEAAQEIPQRSAGVEGPGKPFTCVLCGESWSRLTELLSHQMVRCEVRPHRCPVCAKSFAKKQHLSAHRKTHTEAKPYTCGQCGKSFRQNSTLTTHLWSHAGHKPFLCTICAKRFSRKTDLIAHVRRHTGERPYECPYCWERFIRKKSLQRHLQKHAGEALGTGWDFMAPAGTLNGAVPERILKRERDEGEGRLAHVSPERRLSSGWTDSETDKRTKSMGEERPASRPLGQTFDAAMEREVEEAPAPEPVETTHRSTQTEPQKKKTPTAIPNQRILKELRRLTRTSARTQQEWDSMRLAVSQLSEEMRELKEMVGTLCAAKASPAADRPATDLGALLAPPSCPVWINQERTSGHLSEDGLSVASGRASPESSHLCGPGYPAEALSDHSKDRASWVYMSSSHDEDDELRRTTEMISIKREQDLEPSTSPGSTFGGAPDYSRYGVGERLPNIAMHPLCAEKERALLAKSGGKPGRFAALVFRALVPFDVYKGWVNRVNLDGLRGRKGIPLNVKRRMMGVVESYFTLRKSEHREIRNRLNEQLRTRRKSSQYPLYFY